MSHVAIDIGANGGKVFVGDLSEGLVVKEAHRCDNRPIQSDDRLVWNTDRFQKEIMEGLKKAERIFGEIDSLAIDSWGVDFGLIKDGNLIRKPYSYRDPKLMATVEDILKITPKKEVFKATGINHWQVPNTLFQYHYLSQNEKEILNSADKIILMPQLISWLLGGEHSGEETYASTTQMMNPRSRGWAKDFLRKHDLPTNILPELEKPGTKIGQVKEHYAEELESTPEILLPASHDTASAVAGMPLGEGHKAFLSTGTWFIGGVELDKPLLTDGAFEIEASNELGVEGTTRFLKNINGFFLLEECREEWKEKNGIYEYDEILDAAFNAGSLGSLIDPNNDSFVTEGNMTEKITSYCRETGQKVPKGEGEIARCIFESLAIKTALIMDDILKVAGDSPDILHLGGGGVRNELFCQMLSSAIGIPIHAGPIEAAAIGNILVQARARSEIGDIEEGRKLIRRNLKIRKYEPQEPDRWEEGKNRISLL